MILSKWHKNSICMTVHVRDRITSHGHCLKGISITTNCTLPILNPKTTTWSDCSLALWSSRCKINLMLLVLDLSFSDITVVRRGCIVIVTLKLFWWCCIFVSFILLFCLVCIAVWLMLIIFITFNAKSFDNIWENTYSLSAISKKNEILWPSIYAGWDINFLSLFEEFISPLTSGINLVMITSSKWLWWLKVVEIAIEQNVPLCLNTAAKHEYAAWGSNHASLHNVCNSWIQ